MNILLVFNSYSKEKKMRQRQIIGIFTLTI